MQTHIENFDRNAKDLQQKALALDEQIKVTVTRIEQIKDKHVSNERIELENKRVNLEKKQSEYNTKLKMEKEEQERIDKLRK